MSRTAFCTDSRTDSTASLALAAVQPELGAMLLDIGILDGPAVARSLLLSSFAALCCVRCSRAPHGNTDWCSLILQGVCGGDLWAHGVAVALPEGVGGAVAHVQGVYGGDCRCDGEAASSLGLHVTLGQSMQ